jgi:glycosyltransferase involved in cell wall biosynthesis
MTTATTAHPRLSACVITRNEADRIRDCLASLDFCDEVLVVDSHSTDRTREIAAEMGAWVIERDWPGFGPQREFAAGQVSTDWVLCIDADERVSPELRREIVALRDARFPGCAGWSFPRLSNYLGTWVRHGTWYPDRVLRLYDRLRGRWGDDPPHAHLELDGPVGTLRGELLHYPYRSFAEHLHTIDRYTTIMAERLHAEGRRARSSDLLLRPAVRFLRFYVLRHSFLLGWKGLLLAYLAAHYVRLKYAKLLLLQSGLPLESGER